MIEAENLILEHQPTEGKFYYPGHNYPRFVNIPLHLIDASNKFGIERAEFAEVRVMNILKNETNVVENVIRHDFKSADDLIGHDLTVILKSNEANIDFAHIQVKASGALVADYKQWIRDKYFPHVQNPKGLINAWLTDNKIILINGAETKTYQEILKESFYPQLERIQKKYLSQEVIPDQLIIFPAVEQIQLFPEAA